MPPARARRPDAVISNARRPPIAGGPSARVRSRAPVALASDGIKPVATLMPVPPRQFWKQHRCAVDGTRDRDVADAVLASGSTTPGTRRPCPPAPALRPPLLNRSVVISGCAASISANRLPPAGRSRRQVRRVNSLRCGRPRAGDERDDDEGWSCMSRDYSISLAAMRHTKIIATVGPASADSGRPRRADCCRR